MFDPVAFEERALKLPMQVYLQEIHQLENQLKRDKRNPQLLFAHALMLLRTESFSQAVSSLKKAHKLAPKSEEILKSLSEILFLSSKNYADALRYFRKWSMMRKDEPVILIHIAECQLKLGKPGDALATLEKVEKINPDLPNLYTTKADVFTKLGDVDKARGAFEKSLEIEESPRVASQLLMLPGYKPDEAALQKLADIAEKTGEDRDGEASNLFLSNLATAYEKRKEYARAFEYFQRSNEMPRKRLDRESNLAAFQNIRDTFTREYIKSQEGQGHPSDKPIFVVGMPRSGTTLTESILAGHRDIIDNGELPFLHAQFKNFGLYNVNNPLLADTLPSLSKVFSEFPDGYFRRLGERYIDDSGFQKKRDKFQVDKLPHNFMCVGLIHLVFPNAKIIHCRRNPIDGALSCYKASFSEFHAYATDLEFLGLYYRQYFELMKFWRELFPGKMFEVFYEDTVTNTEFVARNMIDHIGLEWDDNCLDHTKSKETVATASQWQVRQPIYTSSVAKWKNYEEQLQPMIKTMGSCVAEYEAELAALSGKE